jgi:hypothetical protein
LILSAFILITDNTQIYQCASFTAPELVCESRVYGAPDLFNLYKLREEIEERNEENENNDITFGR